jgi:hypothetical protein
MSTLILRVEASFRSAVVVVVHSHFLAMVQIKGAYSYHRGRDFRATKEIHAGQEIFLDYGWVRSMYFCAMPCIMSL